MNDQLIIGNKSSFDDFRASVAKRAIGMPAKKSIKETVPFSNKTYEFSNINGELYWEERELEYIFEIIAPTPERLEELKMFFANWVMNVTEEIIQDPYIPDYHFIGTYDDMECEDDDGMDKCTITVKFTAYPYKISNLPNVYNIAVPSASEKTVTVINNSSHRIVPTITTDCAVIITIEGASYSIGAGEFTDETLMLPAGAVSVAIQNNGESDCTMAISFYEEVF